ncbi:MAG: SRPBCC domain-containing protein [Actinomycetota bacterium]
MRPETVEREVLLPIDGTAVWAALTRPEQMSAWFGARAEFEARVGASATFTWADGTTRRATIEALLAERLLVLRWHPFDRGPDGATRQRPAGTVRFVLEPDPAGTRLTVLESSEAAGEFEVEPPRFLDPSSQDPTSGPSMEHVGS